MEHGEFHLSENLLPAVGKFAVDAALLVDRNARERSLWSAVLSERQYSRGGGELRARGEAQSRARKRLRRAAVGPRHRVDAAGRAGERAGAIEAERAGADLAQVAARRRGGVDFVSLCDDDVVPAIRAALPE